MDVARSFAERLRLGLWRQWTKPTCLATLYCMTGDKA